MDWIVTLFPLEQVEQITLGDILCHSYFVTVTLHSNLEFFLMHSPM